MDLASFSRAKRTAAEALCLLCFVLNAKAKHKAKHPQSYQESSQTNMMLTHDCGHKHPRAAFNLTILIMFIEGRPSLFDGHVLMHKAHTNGRTNIRSVARRSHADWLGYVGLMLNPWQQPRRSERRRLARKPQSNSKHTQLAHWMFAGSRSWLTIGQPRVPYR